jgi:hypothetical protein
MRREESQLRHPSERPLFVAFAILNVLLMAGAIFVAVKGADWLKSHPTLAGYRGRIRTLAIAAIVGVPAIVLLRNTRRALMRGKSIVISPKQLPQIHAILRRHCEKLEIRIIPELYFTDAGVKQTARAYRSRRCDYIVLASRLFQPDLQPMLSVFSFWLGGAVGSLRLGHASWQTEFLLAYVDRIPHLSNSLRRAFTYSEDRYAAYLAPEGLPALVGLASGRLMLPGIDISEHMKQVQHYGGIWAWFGLMTQAEPTPSQRIRALLQAGLWKPELTAAELSEAQLRSAKTATP